MNLFPEHDNNMETEKKKSTYKPKEHAPRNCALESCGEEFQPKNDRAKYCSASCNATASKIRTAMNHGMNVPALNGLVNHPNTGMYAIPPHASMMIDLATKEANRWENLYNKEVEKRESIEKKFSDLKDEVSEDENPKGALGFVQNNPELLNKALDVFGPVLAGWFAKKDGSIPQTAIEGTPQVHGDTGQYVKLFAEWMAKLNDESQKNVWQLLSLLSHTDEEKMNYSILNLLQQWH